MFLIKAILLAVFVGYVPLTLGHYVTARMNDGKHGMWSVNWLMGMALMFAQMQLLAVPLIIFKCRFHTLFNWYVAIVAVETIIGTFRYVDNMRQMFFNLWPRLKKLGVLWAIVVLSIALQAGMLAYFEHVDDDDARFVPTAVAAVQKDLMLIENPVTGRALYGQLSESFKDMVSPWIMFWAVLSKVTVIHPAILMHSIVPLFMIPLAYAVYWLLAGYLFEDDVKKVIFVGLVSAINIFSGYSVFNPGAFLLFRIWQGKAMFASIFIPLHMVCALRFYRTTDSRTISDYILISIVCCGACLTSGFGIILSGMFWGIVSLIYGIGKKDLRGMLFLWCALIPCVVYAFLYAFGEKVFTLVTTYKFFW